MLQMIKTSPARWRSVFVCIFGLSLILNTLYLLDISVEAPIKRVKQISSRIKPSLLHREPSVDAVVASIRSEYPEWIGRLFPKWNARIYHVDSDEQDGDFQVPVNRGHEGMAYLSYLVDQYDNLPDFVLFLHAKRWQWHNDDPDFDGWAVLNRLKFDHVRKVGFALLRCSWSPGCPVSVRPFANYTMEDFQKGTLAGDLFAKAYSVMFPDEIIPQEVGNACCAQFAVTRERILQRPRTDYIRIRNWLLTSGMFDQHSGRVLEYSWPKIFGMEDIHCPPAEQCYCDLFGLCDLVCKENNCPEVFTPPYLGVLPVGWPIIDENGKYRNFTNPF